MLNGQSISAVALDTLGSNGLDTQSSLTALGNNWFTKADNISFSVGGRVAFREGAIQGTTVNDLEKPIGSIAEHKNASSTALFVSYGGDIARLELTERNNAFQDVYSPAGVTTSDWQWTNFNNKLIGVQDNSIKPIIYNGDYSTPTYHWEYLEDHIDTTVDVLQGEFIKGRKYIISAVGDDVDWSSVGGSTTAEVNDRFTANSDGAGLSVTSEAHPGFTAPEGVTAFTPTCSLGYYGRLWVGGITEEKDVLHFSALLDENTWWTAHGEVNNLNDAGYIDLKTVWGKDDIVAIHAYAGKLVIFGKNNIAIYNSPTSLIGMHLDEVIRGIGCVARDSIQSVGDDILFLSDTGVRSLTRTAEFDKLPMKEISVSIKSELISNIRAGGKITSTYLIDEGMYLLSFAAREEIYVFDLTYTTEINTPRITKWVWKEERYPTALAYSEDYGFLMGQQGGRVATYGGYWDRDFDGSLVPYKGSISSVWVDLGQGVQASILKRILVVIAGGQDTNVSLRTYKDFSTSPLSSYSFDANPTLTGVPAHWAGATSPSAISKALRAVARQIQNEVVELPGDSVLSTLINELMFLDAEGIPGEALYGESRFIKRGMVKEEGTYDYESVDDMAIGSDNAVQFLRFAEGLEIGEEYQDRIQTYTLDYMMANLDTYGVYFDATLEGTFYGCNTEYNYAGSGFCSVLTDDGEYTEGVESLMSYRDSTSCESAGLYPDTYGGEATQHYQWNSLIDSSSIPQPDNCSLKAAKYAPVAGFIEGSLPLAGTAKYLRIEMDGITAGHETSLQSLSLLYKQGKTL